MQRQLWKAILQLIKQSDKPRFNPRQTYSAELIVKVWMWSVIHDRPVSWACQACNWPPYERRWQLPSNTTMSRRLRCEKVQLLLNQIEAQVLKPGSRDNLIWFIDGKPLVISGCSKDRQAGFGRAAGCKAKGYKMHVILGSDGSVAHWRLAPMNQDERVMAQRMLKTSSIQGYVIGDGNYDSNKLHQICDNLGNTQFIARRRYGKNRGMGHRKQTKGRIRSKDILESPISMFGEQLLKQRDAIERFFGNLCNWGGGLTCLPAWCRTHRRVHRWVQAKLILCGLKRELK